MNDQTVIDLPFVAFHWRSKHCHKSLQMAIPTVAKNGESTQKYNHGTEATSLELSAAS